MKTNVSTEKLAVYDTTDQYEESGWQLEHCFIPVKSSDVSRIYESFYELCKKSIKETMLSCEFSEYPDYLKMRFQDFYYPAQNPNDVAIFDFDASMERLDIVLDYHITAKQSDNDCYSGIVLTGTEFCESYNLFEELLGIATRSSYFTVNEFIVNSRDLDSSDRWMTIYDKKGKVINCVQIE